jgi:hypothetical protein
MDPHIFTFDDFDILLSNFGYDPDVCFHPEYTDSPTLCLPRCDWCDVVGKGIESPIRLGSMKRVCYSCFRFIEWGQRVRERNRMELEDVNVTGERKRKVWGFIHPSILCRNIKPHKRKYSSKEGKLISSK